MNEPSAAPFPAGLDDCMDAYRGLLRERPASDIIVSGSSAGGDLAAALLLRARDEGLPMPAGLILGTRDLYLSNTVRMHGALRDAGVPAQLHVTEAGPHTGFPGAPEGERIDREIREFVRQLFS